MNHERERVLHGFLDKLCFLSSTEPDQRIREGLEFGLGEEKKR
jgi:hypothetical protein